MTDDASACPLARLCAETERLLARRAEAARELEEARDTDVRDHAVRVIREVDRSLTHIAARASDLRPESRRGALFTLALAAADVEELPDADETEPAARLRRRLHALRGFLEAGDPLPGPVMSRWMRVDADPLSWLAE
ncbi:hypothetical protein [Salinarimonas ramus]|uniref:Uncharacterized protein n=1 Tax=Salinarimonas ramus TaxID=690164 RepID=A0A917VA13_9HYPH|nr:hypothetical protein [Salinarimonas ramus]GGK53819.1 hypothetical protein GCM10011322_45780 [Salinarimonas ramus]